MNEIYKAIEQAIDDYISNLKNQCYDPIVLHDVYDEVDKHISNELSKRLMKALDDEFGIRKVVIVEDTDDVEYKMMSKSITLK